MKTVQTLKTLALVSLAGLFCACESKDSTNGGTPMSISIAKGPEFVIESGGSTLASTIGTTTRAGVEGQLQYFKKSDCPDLYRRNFPAQKLYKEECELVYACIKEDAALIAEGKPAKYEVDKGSFSDKAFYIVNAYSSNDHDAKGGHSDVAGKMHDLGINGVKIEDFNTNTCTAADLILANDGLQDVTYDDSFGTKKDTYTTSNWKLFFIPELKAYYIGMDYGTNKFGYEPDGDFSDWVVKIVPAKKDIPDVENGEVEINLSINDEHVEGDFIATKTSIHIRSITDAEVFIPIDKKFYCEADDMDISISHRQYDVVYNTQPRYVEKVIGGKVVKFQVEYEDAGIRITTEGVAMEVIHFCANEYADGITFEVWNYFKDITRADLKAILDKTTVRFLGNNPATYVNAFAKIVPEITTPIYNKFNDAGQLVPYTDICCTIPLDPKYWSRETPESKDYIFVGILNPYDCTVTPVEPSYVKGEVDTTDPTLSDYNVIYTLGE